MRNYDSQEIQSAVPQMLEKGLRIPNKNDMAKLVLHDFNSEGPRAGCMLEIEFFRKQGGRQPDKNDDEYVWCLKVNKENVEGVEQIDNDHQKFDFYINVLLHPRCVVTRLLDLKFTTVWDPPT